MIPWAAAHQAPLCVGFPRQEYWSGLPFPTPGDLPNPGIEPTSLTLAGRFFTIEPPGKPMCVWCMQVCGCVCACARLCVYLAMLCALWDLGFPNRATAVRAQGPNHWAAGEFPKYVYFEFLEHKCGQNSNCTNKPMTKTPKFLVKGGVLNMHMWLCKLLNLH